MSENLVDYFRCARCEGANCEEVTINARIVYAVLEVTERGHIDYGARSENGGNVAGFRCTSCHTVLNKENKYPVENSEELFDFLMEARARVNKKEKTRREVLAAALETPGDLTPEELAQAKEDIIKILLESTDIG